MFTECDIMRGITELGIRSGDTLEVHASLSSFGEVEGGAETVTAALKTCCSADGIILMPALRLSQKKALFDTD